MQVLRLAVCFAVLGMALVAGGGRATAQNGTTPTPTTPTPSALTASDFLIRIEQKVGNDWPYLQDAELARFFTRARCECGEQIRVRVELSTTGNAKVTTSSVGYVRTLLGSTSVCVAGSATERRSANCPQLGSDIQLAAIKNKFLEVPLTVTKLFLPNGDSPAAGGCAMEAPQNVWLWVDTANVNAPDASLTDSNAPFLKLALHGKSPAAPGGVRVVSGGEALEVSWDAVTGDPNFVGGGYMVFCARAGEIPVFNPSYFSGQFSSAVLCSVGAPLVSATASPELLAAPIEAADVNGTKVTSPEAFKNLDPAFVCSDLLTSQTSTRIRGLQNDIPYVVGVASVDRVGNPSPITEAYLQFPIATRDFYRGYRMAGGSAEGGFCTVARSPHGSRSLLALPAVAALALATRRRRRPR
jgi:hypothetical protein